MTTAGGVPLAAVDGGEGLGANQWVKALKTSNMAQNRQKRSWKLTDLIFCCIFLIKIIKFNAEFTCFSLDYPQQDDAIYLVENNKVGLTYVLIYPY